MKNTTLLISLLVLFLSACTSRNGGKLLAQDDSLIQMAARYYDTHKDAVIQARAYYYWGSFYRDKNNFPKAIDKYTIALSHINDRPESAELKTSL